MDTLALQKIQEIAPKVFEFLARKALSYGEFRGGSAIGFQDEDGRIWSVVSIVNPELPSRWGDANDQYDLYAGLKLTTALRFQLDTVRLPPEKAPLMAVHPGGVARFHPELQVWIGVSYSGHHGEEDKELAFAALQEFF